MASIKEMFDGKSGDSLWNGYVESKPPRTIQDGEAVHMESSTVPKTDEKGASRLDLFENGVANVEKYMENLPEGLSAGE